MGCRSSLNCLFRIRCTYDSDTGVATVVRLTPEHNCLGTAPTAWGEHSKMSFLVIAVPNLLTITTKTNTAAIVDVIRRHHRGVIALCQTQKVKQLLLCDDLTSQTEDFNWLPAYIQRLIEANEDVYTDLDINDSIGQFQRIFICSQTAAGNFVFRLPFIVIDRTFLKTRFQQTLLLAVGRDPNNETHLLAWAIVKSESETFWRYFLQHLKTAIQTSMLRMSAVHWLVIGAKELLTADDEFPNAHRAYCCFHIGLKLVRHFRKQSIKDVFLKHLCRAKSNKQFGFHMWKVFNLGMSYVFVICLLWGFNIELWLTSLQKVKNLWTTSIQLTLLYGVFVTSSALNSVTSRLTWWNRWTTYLNSTGSCPL